MAHGNVKVNDKTWDAVVDYVERRMDEIRKFEGKFSGRGEEMWYLKEAMNEVDSSIGNVGKDFDEYENNIYERGGVS